MKSLFKLSILILGVSCRPYSTVYLLPTKLLTLDSSYPTENNKISSIISPYQQSMAAEMNREIGFCLAFLEKQKPSSALGSFMADAIFDQAKLSVPNLDFCILNYGGIRSTLDSGVIMVRDIYELMPFENEIVVLTISKSLLDSIVLTIQAKNGEPFSKELLTLPLKEKYTIATSDYMANGGDDYAFLVNAEGRTETSLKIRDALIAYIKLNPTLELDFLPRKL